MNKYQVIYVDCPWSYAGQVQHGGRGALYTSGAHSFYPTMTPDQLKELPVADLADQNCVLAGWTTGPQMDIAIDVFEAWGFRFKTVLFVWDKERVNPGAYTMSQYEYVLRCDLGIVEDDFDFCLAHVRGQIPKPRGSRNERQKISEPRTTHSTKPEEARARLDRMFPTQRKIELFARKAVDGWDRWGNEAPDGPGKVNAWV